MKKLIVLLLCFACTLSCRKSLTFLPTNLFFNDCSLVQLKDSLSLSIFDSLDYENIVLTKLNQKNITTIFLRIPFKEKPIESSFILLRMNEYARIMEGRIVCVDYNTTSQMPYTGSTGVNETQPYIPSQFNGHIKIQYLNGMECLSSQVTNGYIDKIHQPEISAKTDGDIVVTPPKPNTYKVLPEIVITASNGGGGGSSSYATWYSLGSMLYGSSTSGTGYITNGSGISGYYSSSTGGSTRSNGGGLKERVTKDNYVREGKTILIDFELLPDDIIDVNSYLKCFGLLSDNGANCSIELFSDIPVDENPMAGFNTTTLSPGHSFIQLCKEVSGQKITQNIGFYPSSQLKTLLTTAPQDGVFADNGGHEFNASIKMSITTEQLKNIIDNIKKIARSPKYDIDDYNCTDFAIQIFNSVRGSNSLEIPRLDIPESMNPFGSNTPQGVYLKLKEMKSKNSPEASNITLPGVKGYAGNSHGACN